MEVVDLQDWTYDCRFASVMKKLERLGTLAWLLILESIPHDSIDKALLVVEWIAGTVGFHATRLI